MKTVSKNLILFSIMAAVLSILFFAMLYSAVAQRTYGFIFFYSIGYGLGMFGLGWYFGKRDREAGVVLAPGGGFNFHLATFLVVNPVQIIFAILILGWSDNVMKMLAYSIIPWAFGLAIHYWATRKNIKGMEPEDLFD